VFAGGLTYNSHAVCLAAALATIRVYEEDGLIEHAAQMGEVMTHHHEELTARHPSVGVQRSIGCSASSSSYAPCHRRTDGTVQRHKPRDGQLYRFLLDNGVFVNLHWNQVMTNPPLPITDQELAEGFEVLDRALEITDRAVTG